MTEQSVEKEMEEAAEGAEILDIEEMAIFIFEKAMESELTEFTDEARITQIADASIRASSIFRDRWQAFVYSKGMKRA